MEIVTAAWTADTRATPGTRESRVPTAETERDERDPGARGRGAGGTGSTFRRLPRSIYWACGRSTARSLELPTKRCSRATTISSATELRPVGMMTSA